MGKAIRFQLFGAAALALCFLLFASAPVQAAGKPSLLVLHVESESLGEKQKAQINADVKKTLTKYHKYTLMATPKIDLLDEMVNFECLEMDGACLSAIGKKHNADLVLYSSFENGKLSMKLVDVVAKGVTGEHNGSTSAKGLKAIMTRDGLTKLFGAVPVKKAEPKPVLVRFGSNVKSAEVFLGQERIGNTPIEKKLKPGTYWVTMRAPEFEDKKKELTVLDGSKPINLSLELKMKQSKARVVVVAPVEPPRKKDKKDGKDDDTPFYAAWWFWTIVGVGAAAAVTGTVLALSAGDDGGDVGTVRFSISPTAAENDAIFYTGASAGGSGE